MNNKVYISGALTGVKEPTRLKELYEKIGQLCEEFQLKPYLPHQWSDPILHPGLSAEQVYRRNKEEVRSSELLIAYLGVPSSGVGSEIEMAAEHGVPAIIFYEADKGPVSRMVRGNPAIIADLACSDLLDALNKLRAVLENFVTKHTPPHQAQAGIAKQ